MDFKQDKLIEAWKHECLVANEFNKRGYKIERAPVCMANPHAEVSLFREDCDFTATKKGKTWKVMVKGVEALNDLDHDNPIQSIQDLDLCDYKSKAWGEKGKRRLPTDPTWSNKFWMHCSKEEIPQWYGERVWVVADQDVNSLFIFRGENILKENLRVRYYGDQMWNFMPVKDLTVVWSESWQPYLDEPW